MRIPFMCLQDANSADAKVFEKAAEAIDDIPFAMTSDDAAYSKFVSKDSVVLFKKVSSFPNILKYFIETDTKFALKTIQILRWLSCVALRFCL